jgi:hypothetical protein
VGQVFDANERVGMAGDNLLADGVIGVQLQPSLSLRQRDATPGGAASAFPLKSFLQAGIMIYSLAYLLSTIELGVARGRGNRGQITLAHIDADHLIRVHGHRIRTIDHHRHQQVEALFALVIPQLGSPEMGPVLLQKRHVLLIPLVAYMNPVCPGPSAEPRPRVSDRHASSHLCALSQSAGDAL